MQCIMLLRAQRPSRWPGWQAASGWSSRCADHARPPHWRVEGRAATGVDEFGVAVEGRTFLELIWSVAGPPQLRPPLPGLVLHQKGRSLASKNFQVFSQFLAKMFKTSFVSNVAFGPLTRLPWSSRTESGCVWMINLNLFGIWSATWKQLDRSSVILTALFRRSSSWSSYTSGSCTWSSSSCTWSSSSCAWSSSSCAWSSSSCAWSSSSESISGAQKNATETQRGLS